MRTQSSNMAHVCRSRNRPNLFRRNIELLNEKKQCLSSTRNLIVNSIKNFKDY